MVAACSIAVVAEKTLPAGYTAPEVVGNLAAADDMPVEHNWDGNCGWTKASLAGHDASADHAATGEVEVHFAGIEANPATAWAGDDSAYHFALAVVVVVRYMARVDHMAHLLVAGPGTHSDLMLVPSSLLCLRSHHEKTEELLPLVDADTEAVVGRSIAVVVVVVVGGGVVGSHAQLAAVHSYTGERPTW